MYNKENLTKLKKMDNLAPEVMKAFWAFDKLAARHWRQLKCGSDPEVQPVIN